MAQMETIETYEAPEVEIPNYPRLAFIPNKDWHLERVAFYRLLPDLLKTHRGRYVAIYQGTVVGHGETPRQVSLEAHRQYGEVSIYIGLVSEQPAAPIRIPSVRIVPARWGKH